MDQKIKFYIRGSLSLCLRSYFSDEVAYQKCEVYYFYIGNFRNLFIHFFIKSRNWKVILNQSLSSADESSSESKSDSDGELIRAASAAT